jgi:hypothetical protein
MFWSKEAEEELLKEKLNLNSSANKC